MKRHLIAGSVLLCTLALINFPLHAQTNQNDEAQWRNQDLANTAAHTDWKNTFGYTNFGPQYWAPVGFWNYPTQPPNPATPTLTELSIPLRSGAQADAGADSSGWAPVTIDGQRTYYRAEYLLKDIQGVHINQMVADADAYYASQGKRYWQPNDYSTRRNDLSHESTDIGTYQRAKITMVVFPSSQFRLQYYPGSQLLFNSMGSLRGAHLARPRGGIAWNPYYDRVNPADYSRLVGVFKGTFDNLDGIRGGHPPGLIVNGQVVDQPLGGLATVATLTNGSLDIGYASEMQGKPISMLRQNEYLMLHKGQIVDAGAYPFGWNRFPDDITRSYLVETSDHKYFGYVWAMYAHPSMVAKVMQKIGFGEMMLLDIHPTLGATFLKPNALSLHQNLYNGGSYNLIPAESQVMKGLRIRALWWAARAYHGRMQWPYQWSKTGSLCDFFAVMTR